MTELDHPGLPLEVCIVDPDAFTPYYDRNLAHALGRRGWSVELLTSRSQFEDVAAIDSIAVAAVFFRRMKGGRWPVLVRRGLKALAYPSGLGACSAKTTGHGCVSRKIRQALRTKLYAS